MNKIASGELYIGLMSGTSADGIDLALVEFNDTAPLAQRIKFVASYYQAYDQATHNLITSLYSPSNDEIDRAFSLDGLLAQQFAQAIELLLQQQNLTTADITAIGCHGQTIRHRPSKSAHIQQPFTLQIGCLQTLAMLTGIRVIGDFRRKDIALGGQGAPLVPAFHRALFQDNHQDVVIVNIGGIANITFLPHQEPQAICGFDTGPGNALLDYWYQQHQQGRYDKNGDWAKQGQVIPELLADFSQDPYFSRTAPKSTGREYFNPAWLQPFSLSKFNNAADVQASLTALTATTIAEDIKRLTKQANIYLCGGGALNKSLVYMINQELKGYTVQNTSEQGIDSDALEAMAFAWLAYAFDKKIAGNIPAVTGASKQVVLGICANP